MIHLNLEGAATRALQILCLGCHSDDIEIGCGGTILRLAQEYPNCVFHWVVFSATGVREAEAKYAAAQFVHIDHLKGPLLKTFADGFMPFVGAEVKAVFEELKQTISPDLIFTHHRKDAHQDHRLVAELTWNTFRNHLILEYEIPKYEGGLTTPAAYIELTRAQAERKISILWASYPTQRAKSWFTDETFRGLMRLRGIESGGTSGWAEGFHASKFLLG